MSLQVPCKFEGQHHFNLLVLKLEDLCPTTEHFLIALQDHAISILNYRKQTHISNEPVVAASPEDAVLTRKQNKMSGRNQ